jgi:spore maturation protein CgeB
VRAQHQPRRDGRVRLLAGACLITDAWRGIEQFLEPGAEVLVAHSGEEVAAHVAALRPETARAIGARALRRVWTEHTYAHRAVDFEAALGERTRSRPTPPASPRAVRAAAPAHPLAPRRPMSIVMLGLSITSSWGNGHATTYRGLARELAARGHRVLFLERDAPWYAQHRDLPQPPYARTELYGSQAELHERFAHDVREADLVIVGSYVPDGAEVGRWVVETARGLTAFYDIDTPVTLARLATNDCPYLDKELVRRYGLYLSFTGGPTLIRIERELGAQRALPLYCAADPREYRPELRPMRWDLGYMGTYSRDRQPAVERLLTEPARREPARRFVVAGPQYPAELAWPANVERLEHLAPDAHRAFYNELGFALNVTRADMLAAGWSPSVRLFEAAACGTPIITDSWPGIDELFEPNHEILIARTTEDVLRYLRDLGEGERRAIGARACIRVRSSHTAAHRAADLERYAREP